jgi:hypothetical protein
LELQIVLEEAFNQDKENMHVPLDEHLHTEECNVIIRLLHKCHQENSLGKQFFGVCNDLDTQMRACLKKERIATRDQNIKESKVRNEEIRRRMANLKSDDWRENLKEKFKEQES